MTALYEIDRPLPQMIVVVVLMSRYRSLPLPGAFLVVVPSPNEEIRTGKRKNVWLCQRSADVIKG